MSSSRLCVNRRSLVGAAALAGVGLAATAVLSGDAQAEEALAAVDVPAWLGQEPEVAADEMVRTEACDILIVGAGCAGLAAAATASDMGLNFICCDKAEVVPETREYLGAVNTKYSPEPVDEAKLLNELVRYASGKCDRNLIKLWIDESREMIEWIDPMIQATGKTCSVAVAPDHATGGTDYMTPSIEHSWPIPYVPPTRNEILLAHIQENGDDVRFGWELVKLVHGEDGVSGAIFKAPAGYVQIDAPYVILATGGYAGNPTMMEALQPDALAGTTAASYNAFCDGSGIKCGLWAGGIKENDVSPVLFDRGAVLPGVNAGYAEQDGRKAFPGTIFQLNIGSQPFLKVNRRGERFANESTPYDNMVFAAGRQPGGVFCQVFDANAPEDIKRFMTIGCASYTRMMMEQGMPLEDFIAMDGGAEVVMKADTLDELADQLGFEGDAKDAFLATCEHYNELFDAQEDSDYGKEAYRLSALRTPPFYGCWFGGSLLTTLDGLRINASMQVLDAVGDAVPGLYAVGDCSGSFFATNYPEYIVGVAAGRSVTEGRQVVKRIAGSSTFVATERTSAAGDTVEAIDPSQVPDGTYTGSGAGMGGEISVTIEVAGGRLGVVEIGPNNETVGIGGYEAIEDGTYAAQVEAAQGPEIDGVAGATITSKAIAKAVREALTSASK